MKKVVSALLLLSLLLCSLPVGAIVSDKTVVMVIDQQAQTLEKADVYVNKTKADVSAFMYNDRIYVPLRAVGTLMGCKIDWDGATEIATIENELTTIAIQRGSAEMAVTDRRMQQSGDKGAVTIIALDSVPVFARTSEATSDTLMVPVRAISEALSAQVRWNEALRIVYITSEYESISNFYNGVAIVEKDKKFGLISAQGETLISPIYKTIYIPAANNITAVMNANGQWGFVNTTGDVIVTPRYNAVRLHVNGYAAINSDNKWGFIDETGKLVVSAIYSDANDFSEGLVAVKRNDKYGFINGKGETVIPFEYDDATCFSEGYAAVRQLGKWGYIDKAGNVILQFQYESAGEFHNGKALVKDGQSAYYITPWGSVIN